MINKLKQLAKTLEGDLFFDKMIKTLYATDASSYREFPLAVAIPKTQQDIAKLIQFASTHQTSLIPRTAGTSLAGQVVGSGIVVDVSKHFNKILELNKEQGWVRVEPGVIRDELNMFLQEHGLFFGPETSTANRAMVGGMVGNNSCGSNSVVYKSTREHLLEVKAFLSDGTQAVFSSVSTDAFHQKCDLNTLEGNIYRSMRAMLSNYENQVEIKNQFPKKSILRRNTGYAIDILVDADPFTAGGPPFNFCNLIAGSEGTLAFITEIKLNLVPIPAKEVGLLCVHFNSIDESLRANLIGLQFQPSASELIDHYILECTKENAEQAKNRFFVQGDPGAILVIEFVRETKEEILELTQKVEAAMRAAGLGYHFPVLYGADAKKIWALRKAGLGLLSNLPGDEKAVPVIEDTAVDVNDLPDYIREFNEILKKHGLYSVHYAHAGSGELHLRPIINLKTEQGNQLFRTIAQEVATLVKKYKGSLSGEHGDGRLRGEFIQQMVGAKNYALLEEVKNIWDPQHILNPNKIVHTPSMNSMLRYTPGQFTPAFKTIFRFHQQNILQHAEQCNGSGDCRKTHLSGGTMCPSYMATRDEKDTTRARANILREFLTHSEKENRFDHKEIYEVMSLCLSCKACKSECPSNVDMAKLKAEFLQHYYDANGVPFRARLIANFTKAAQLASMAPRIYNTIISNPLTASVVKLFSGFALQRSMPKIAIQTLQAWYKKNYKAPSTPIKKLYLFCDEFTNYNDAPIGIKAIELLHTLGYEVIIPFHLESGRTWLSKGLVRKAKKIANQNIELLSSLISASTPLIGLEPSAILTFRDEYPDLATDENVAAAQHLAKHSFFIDEFLASEMQAGNITKDQFTDQAKSILLHGHCQQKAVSSLSDTVKVLSFPTNFKVDTIASGCCGMAGSFGYEKEHYKVSMNIGELVLFPKIRAHHHNCTIAAAGTSCRHQIKDGTGVQALHTVEILHTALR